MPSLERVRFVSSGTEAAMSAVRVARAATGREKIVKFEGCYHGHADAFLVQAGSGALTLGVPTSPGVTRGAAGDTLLASYNDLRLGRASLRGQPRSDRRASSSSRSPGTWALVPPADGFLDALRRLCTAHGRAADLRRGDFRIPCGAGAGRRQRFGDRARPHVPGKDHRRRAAGRRLRRTRRPDGARVAGRPRLSGRHAVGQSAGDDRRHLVSRSVEAASVPPAGRARRRGSRPAWPTRRARPASPCRSTRSDRC